MSKISNTTITAVAGALWLTLVVAVGQHAWATDKFMSYENKLAEAHAEAAAARDTMTNLWSGGRWIRAYDPVTGHQSYRFAPGQLAKREREREQKILSKAGAQ